VGAGLNWLVIVSSGELLCGF